MLFILAAVFVALYVIGSVSITYFNAYPPRTVGGDVTPEKHSLAYQDVTIIGGDGVKLSGWYVRSQNDATVILTHGQGSHRGQMLEHAAVLARHGYGVLLYDMRRHGKSEGSLAVGDRCVPNDVQSALDVDPDRIGALGFSLGADATLVAAARTGAIKAVVLDGGWPGLTFNVTPPLTAIEIVFFPMLWISGKLLAWHTGVCQEPSLAQLIAEISPRPILIIAAGQGGEKFGGRRLYAAAREPKVLWEIPEAKHGEGLAKRHQEYEERLVTFFGKALLKSADSGKVLVGQI
jgi:pimeloyl-ACP methyl ester carboxylesterase